MVGIVKEICIFMIISQAVLFFVPGSSYIKYVRVLVGIMMILRIIEPLFSWVDKEEKTGELSSRIWQLEEQIETESEKLQTEYTETMLYESMEEEIRSRLEKCESSYEIKDVIFSEEMYDKKEYSGEEGLIIKVAEKNNDTEGEIRIETIRLGEKEAVRSDKEEELQRLYGECIGIDAEKIKIVLQ